MAGGRPPGRKNYPAPALSTSDLSGRPINAEEHNYIPDFIVRVKDGSDDALNLIIEVTGEHKKDKAAKVATARTLWVPAVNNHGGFGRWAFIEIDDPWNAMSTIRQAIQKVP